MLAIHEKTQQQGGKEITGDAPKGTGHFVNTDKVTFFFLAVHSSALYS